MSDNTRVTINATVHVHGTPDLRTSLYADGEVSGMDAYASLTLGSVVSLFIHTPEQAADLMRELGRIKRHLVKAEAGREVAA